jgi:hypothetical protein
MYFDFLVALEDWYYAEASVAERKNATAFIWRQFNSLFRPSSRADWEQWRGLHWQEPLVGESEYDSSKWLEATSTDGHTRVEFYFERPMDEVRVRYPGPAHFDVAAFDAAADRARGMEFEAEAEREEREFEERLAWITERLEDAARWGFARDEAARSAWAALRELREEDREEWGLGDW